MTILKIDLYLISQVSDTDVSMFMNKILDLCTFLSILLMNGCPEFPTSLTDITPVFNLEFNENLIVVSIVYSVKASFNISQVSVAALPILK